MPHQHEEKLQNKEFWELIEEFHECFFELDKEGKFIYVNKKMQEAIKYDYKQLLGKKYINFISNLYKNEVQEKLKQHINNPKYKNEKCCFTHDFKTKDKDYSILLEVSGMSVFKNNKFHSFRALARDISGIKQQQEELWIKNSAMDMAMSGIIITTLSHEILYSNEAAYKMFGFKQEDEMLKININQLWAKGKKEYEKYKKFLIKNGEYKKTFLAKRKNNSQFNALIYASSIKDKFGKDLCFMKSITNINDEVESKQKIKEQKERLDAVLDASDQGYWDYNITENILYFSPKWYEILGYKNKEIHIDIQSFYDLVHPDDLVLVKYDIEKNTTKQNGNKKLNYKKEIRLKCKDGTYKWILTKGKVIEFKKGNPSRWVGTHTDITERKQYEQQILQKNKELEYFVHSVSHDIQAPLVTLEGFSGIILEQSDHCSSQNVCNAYQQINDSAQEIKKATRKLSDTIDALLQLSRIGRLHTSRTWVKISDIVNKVLEINTKNIEKAQAEINIKNSLIAHIQEETFISIIQNLINNSLQHAKTDNKLIINLFFEKTKENNLLIMVSDNGPGIPENMKDTIFEPFKRLTNKGNGLGLSIVKKGAELHGGSVCVENNPNGGATFYVELKECFKSESKQSK